MKRSYAALAFAGVVLCTSMTAVAGATAPSTTPGMGATPSQTGADPRTMGSDPSRQGVDNGSGNSAGSSTMSNGKASKDTNPSGIQLPGGGAAGGDVPGASGAAKASGTGAAGG